MPNQKVLESKKQIVAQLAEKMKNAQGGVLVDYRGITVEQDTALRRELREANVDYAVVKNTLVRFAANQIGFEALDPILHDTTAMAVCADDPIAPARILVGYANKSKNFTIKAGFVEGQVVSIDEITELGKLSSKNDLIAKVLGTFNAPLSAFVGAVEAIIKKKEAEGEA